MRKIAICDDSKLDRQLLKVVIQTYFENNEEEFTMIYIRTMNIAPNRLDRAETGKYMVTYMEYVGVKQNLCKRTIRNGCLFLWE